MTPNEAIATLRAMNQDGVNYVGHIADVIESMQATDDTALKVALADLQAWKDAVIGELIVCGIYSKEHDTNPRKALSDAILWNEGVALIPALAAERERCAVACQKSDGNYNIVYADLIRALGDK